VLRGTWDYCSGSAHATHFMCNAMVAGTTDRVTAVMPMDQVTVLDDWGDGATLGMNASGSNSVRVEEVFVASSSSAAKRGTRLQRYYRDVAMYHGHIASQYLTTAGELARVHFGLPDSLF